MENLSQIKPRPLNALIRDTERVSVLLPLEQAELRDLPEGSGIGYEQKRRMMSLAKRLIYLAETGPEAPLRRWGEYFEETLEDLATGLPLEEIAAIEGLEVGGVKARRKRLKTAMDCDTMAQVMVEAIQRGIVKAPELSDEKVPELTANERALLAHIALGWETNEMSRYYSISKNTLSTWWTRAKKKIGAGSTTNAMWRAFELGIFKVDEDIEPGEIDKNRNGEKTEGEPKLNVTVTIDGQNIAGHDVGITTKVQLDLLDAVSQLSDPLITPYDLLQTTFGERYTKKWHRSAAQAALARLARRLEAAVGEPVIEVQTIKHEDGSPRQTFVFRKAVKISGEDKELKINAYSGEIVSPHARPKPTQPKVNKDTKPEPPEVPEAPPEPEAPSPYLEPEEVLPLDDSFWALLRPRKRQEVKDNFAVKLAAESIANRREVSDYRTKVVLALRYGIPVEGMLLHRAGKHTKLADIQEHIPRYQGMDLKSASLLSTFTGRTLLETELAMVKKYRSDFPALAPLAFELEVRIKGLKEE